MIYFIRHVETGLIKIGYTGNLHKRFTSLRLDYGDIEPLGYIDGSRKDESILHKWFNGDNKTDILPGREWFIASTDLMRFIDENALECGINVQDLNTEFKPDDPPDHVSIINRLYKLMKEKESETGEMVSVMDICRATGISKATIYKWIHNRVSRFDSEVIINLCQYFKKDVGDLLTIVED